MKNQSRLNQKIALSGETRKNDHGEIVSTWSAPVYEWAEILTSHGSEAIEAAKDDAEEIVRVRIRYRSDVKTDWRMTWNGQNYFVTSVDRTGNRSGDLWFTAKATEVL